MWTIKSDGTYTDNTTTTGTETIALGASCLTISGTTTTCDDISGPMQALGYSSVTCTSASSGGCSCTATVQQTGGLGVVSASASTNDTYTTSGNSFTNSEGTKFSYCASAGMLTVTPQPASPTVTGTVVLDGMGSSSSSSNKGSTNSSSSTSSSTSSSSSGSSGTTAALQGPCDIYASASPATPCVAAYSTTRRLLSTYTGPLYQVRKGGTRTTYTGDQPIGTVGGTTGGTTQDIGVIAGGFADGAAQDSFCGTSTCTISKLYDQSGKGNDLTEAPAGGYTGTAHQPDYESDATKKSLTISGHKAYALYMIAHDGYRNNSTSGMPKTNAAQGIYEVADGTRGGPACCWDFGNARTDNQAGGTGTMDSIFFGTGYWGKGAGNGPWFLADLEAGVWSGGSGASNTTNSSDPSMNVPYAFGIVESSTSGTAQYAIKAADATTGNLTTAYNGQAPANWNLSGAIILGIGGDNSNSSYGTFFEGAITAGRPSDASDNAVHANVVAAKYGQ